MRPAIIIVLLALPLAAAAQAPKCWKNADGVTECGTQPPPGVSARTVDVPRPATTQPLEVVEQFSEADLDEEQAARRAIQLRHCELARETLRTYQRSDFLYERDATGNRRLLDEEESAAAMAKAEQDVAQQCAEFDDPAP